VAFQVVSIVEKAARWGSCRALDFDRGVGKRLVDFSGKVTLSMQRAKGATHTQNEGTSHDVNENKGAGESMSKQPTMLMRTKPLTLSFPDLTENKDVDVRKAKPFRKTHDSVSI
jgi:gamma-glutamylcysteine synthetase